MIYGSVCSGIEAATAAWHPLGWKPAFFSEIEKFPRAILSHRYPNVPLHGDFTTIGADDYGPIQLLVGGTPCQSFSIAGLRKGLADDRGNLALEFLRLADRTRPRWIVWENVPGVFSSLSHDAPNTCPPKIDLDSGDGPRDGEEVVVEDSYDAIESHSFGCFLAGLQELGYGAAYRVLDAQYAGVPQRRRRVFVVGYLGDWRRAAAVLFERESLRGHPAPRREKGEVAPTVPSRSTAGGGLGTDFDCDGGLIASTGDTAHCLNAGGMGRQDYETETFIAFTAKDHGADAMEDCAPTLRAGGHSKSHANAGVMPAVAFDLRGREGGAQFEGPHDTANIRAAPGGSSRSYVAQSAVRRLTPRECERLQGFPDDFTQIPWRNKPAENCPDGPRYKALGNSMAVPVMSWLGRRIQEVEAACITNAKTAG